MKYLFGTDQLGRDVFSRIITATPNGFSIGFAVVGIALLGQAYRLAVRGVPRGPLRRGADEDHRHLLDPRPDPRHSHRGETGTGHNDDDVRVMVVWWPAYACLSRGETLKVADQNYIEAAKTSGFGTFKIVHPPRDTQHLPHPRGLRHPRPGDGRAGVLGLELPRPLDPSPGARLGVHG